jgi:hypothetical protein
MRFLFLLGNYFELWGVDAGRQVAIAASCLGGTALDWFIIVHNRIANFEDFSTLLRREFEPPNPVESARIAMWNCTHSGSLADYNATFRSLLRLIDDMSQADIADRYSHGLQPHLRKEIRIRQIRNYEDMVQCALAIDHATKGASTSSPSNPPPSHPRSQTHRAAAAAFSPAAPPSAASFPTAPSPAARSPVFADAAAACAAANIHVNQDGRVGPTSRGTILPEVRDILLRFGGCTYCRHLGHSFATCPSRLARYPAPQGQGNAPAQ